MAKKKSFPAPQMPRSMEILSQEYTQLVAQLGEREYRIKNFQKECSDILAKLDELQIEGNASRAIADQVAKEASEKAKSEEVKHE